MTPKHGYHFNEIPKGIAGESSKILEEVHELIDAEKQLNKIMMLNELSDIIGAIKLYIKHRNLGVSISDLVKMAEATERAFEVGHRK